MQDASPKKLLKPVYDYGEKMRSLPEDTRKFFMVATMVIASVTLGITSWLMFSPLQDLTLPSLNTDQHVADGEQSMDTPSKLSVHSQFADASSIPQIGPVSGFMESFKAVKDLIVPKDLQNNLFGNTALSTSWSRKFSDISAGIPQKLKDISLSLFRIFQTFLIYISKLITPYALSLLNKLIELVTPSSK